MKGLVFILIACFIWALDTLIRYPLLYKYNSSEIIVFGEHLFLTILFLPTLYMARKKIMKMKPFEMLCFFMIGAMGSAIATLTFTKSFALLNPSLVILLQKLQPFIAISLAYLILKERITKRFLLWAAVSLFGAILISYQDINSAINLIKAGQVSFDRSSLYGLCLALVSVISWGSATVFGKYLMKSNWIEKEVMSLRFVVGLMAIIPFMIASGTGLNFPIELWGKVSILALISGIFGMYFYYKGLGQVSAKVCTIAEMSFPFFAVIINWVALDQRLTVVQLLGGAFLLLGSTMLQLANRKHELNVQVN
ncbi:DMT family transporter [Halobacteriovorax sp. XZX-3]|uniref:DMT family transporter n=1 Tax=unclassified Halobacteriovorax TaxID=2639665 RepID=UPI000CD19AE7|nr:DMT family transporter [Halobacteriovorax sp. DA5]POB14730.1 EamA family transporter [Halobacteriovorax sp. DA5]